MGKVRMMLSMTMQCYSCGIFIYKGTKFNMHKENVLGEDYLGIHIYRFYFRCPQCSSEITFKTDPINSDYIIESGAISNFVQCKTEKKTHYSDDKCKTEEVTDSIQILENKSDFHKKEIEILE